MDDDQNHPVLDGAEDATDESRLSGLIAQLRNDAAGMPDGGIEKLLETRLADAGITLGDDERSALLEQLRSTPPTEH